MSLFVGGKVSESLPKVVAKSLISQTRGDGDSRRECRMCRGPGQQAGKNPLQMEVYCCVVVGKGAAQWEWDSKKKYYPSPVLMSGNRIGLLGRTPYVSEDSREKPLASGVTEWNLRLYQPYSVAESDWMRKIGSRQKLIKRFQILVCCKHTQIEWVMTLRELT